MPEVLSHLTSMLLLGMLTAAYVLGTYVIYCLRLETLGCFSA